MFYFRFTIIRTFMTCSGRALAIQPAKRVRNRAGNFSFHDSFETFRKARLSYINIAFAGSTRGTEQKF